jgi:HAD superfamily hydrolase (TIGR01490 family)
MKKVGIFDLDGTVYRDTLTFSVAEEILGQPRFKKEQEQVLAAKQIWKERGSAESYWTYNKGILEVFGLITPKVSPEEMDEAARRVLEAKEKYRYAYTTELINRLKKEGRALIAISGSIKNIVDPFARASGFDIVVASELAVSNGAYTGQRVSQTNVSKDKLIQALVDEHGLSMDDSIAIGDTHRDISLLKLVKNPIAFNPNTALYDEAVKSGWPIVIERKNMIYELAQHDDQYVVKSAHPIYPGVNEELNQ